MTKGSNQKVSKLAGDHEGISEITVCGYKSISKPQTIEIRPLTVLAGANSSGKSSSVQPLLLLKQTLEASYDPGTLLLDGPNVRFTAADQFLSRIGKGGCVDSFDVSVGVGANTKFRISFGWTRKKGVAIREMELWQGDEKTTLRPDMSQEEIESIIPSPVRDLKKTLPGMDKAEARWAIIRDRCFLSLGFEMKAGDESSVFPLGLSPSGVVAPILRGLIHLPGLRGNPARTYPVTAVSSTFPGTFQDYVASVIARWEAEREGTKIAMLNNHLEALGLTWKVTANRIKEAQVELRVGRMPHGKRGGAYDLVSMADVGFGVSQTLPVLVALIVAGRGQVVYLEQPEIHLHPRGQVQMASLLAQAAQRGVRVIVETHSSLLLRGIQTLVARGHLSPALVKLHWFERKTDDGSTDVRSAELDVNGAFGDWPQDFDDVTLSAESDYLDAAEAKSTS